MKPVKVDRRDLTHALTPEPIHEVENGFELWPFNQFGSNEL